ncbi:hypothetical protein ECFDA504_1581, partial [Escherichia coli FDA504]
LLESMR